MAACANVSEDVNFCTGDFNTFKGTDRTELGSEEAALDATFMYQYPGLVRTTSSIHTHNSPPAKKKSFAVVPGLVRISNMVF